MTYYGTAGSRVKAPQFTETDVRLMLAKGPMAVSNRTWPKAGRVHWRIAEALVDQGIARFINGPDGRMVELTNG
jgi:hypothetical protein